MDIYKKNCTYYSSLGNDDQAYLLARVLQFLHQVFRRFTTLACCQEKMISNCSNQPKKAATSTVTITIWKKLSEKFNAQLCSPCSICSNSVIPAQHLMESLLLTWKTLILSTSARPIPMPIQWQNEELI